MRDGREPTDLLLQLAYAELRAVAERMLHQSGDGAHLSPSSLVHLASMKLLAQRSAFRDRRHLTAIAVLAMRRLLVDLARTRSAQRRAGGSVTSLNSIAEVEVEGCKVDTLLVDEALASLAKAYPRPAKVVECRIFGGLSVEETASALELSAAQVKRDWSAGITWLRNHWGAADPVD